MKQEIWKDIEGYEGMYQVSNLGRVKALDRRDNKGKLQKEKLRKFGTKKDGYKIISLSKNNKLKSYVLHRIVAKAFVPNPDNLPEIDHINGIRDDNRVENLRWCTRQQNNSYPETRRNNSLAQKRRFERDPLERLKTISRQCPVYLVSETGEILKRYEYVREAADDLHVHASNISACCRGKIQQILGYRFKYANV